MVWLDHTYTTFIVGNECNPSLLCLVETITLRDKLFNLIDPASELLCSSNLDYIIAKICTQ